VITGFEVSGATITKDTGGVDAVTGVAGIFAVDRAGDAPAGNDDAEF
jgi:hypothetical protein